VTCGNGSSKESRFTCATNLRDAVAKHSDREPIHIVERGVLKAGIYRITLQADIVRFVEFVPLPSRLRPPAGLGMGRTDLALRPANRNSKMDRINAADQFLR
jgi:hypothetical protein